MKFWDNLNVRVSVLPLIRKEFDFWYKQIDRIFEHTNLYICSSFATKKLVVKLCKKRNYNFLVKTSHFPPKRSPLSLYIVWKHDFSKNLYENVSI